MIKKDYEMVSGDTFKFGFVLRDKNGVPIDLSGGSSSFTLRESLYSDVLISKSGTVTSEGEVDFELEPNDTSSLIVSKSCKYFVYDVEYTDFEGDVTTISMGNFKIKQGVSR